MLNNRKIQILAATVLIISAVLVTLSAVKAPAQNFISITGSNPEGMAQNQPGERSTIVSTPSDLVKYYQNGLVKYYPSERRSASDSMSSGDTPFNYKQGHWFGQ
jgi:hypothetical protein